MYGQNSESKGLSIDECVRRAEKLIAQQGICVLAMDVKGSYEHLQSNAELFSERLYHLVSDLNSRFREYLPENKIITCDEEQGFKRIRGDQIIGGVNSAKAVKLIYDYLTENYADLPMYWSIAKDGWDDEGFSHVD